MAELAHPIWLLGLLLIPAVHWLHRLRAPGRPLRVPALFLWRTAQAAEAQGTHRAAPDPAWRHRALLAALAVLALAGPHWSRPSAPTIELWLDDGPALFARDAGGDRLTEAARAIAAALAEASASGARLHALHRAGESLELPATDPGTTEHRLRAWLDGPVPGPLSPPAGPGAGVRWLVSTGADQRTIEAISGIAFARVIPVGAPADNQALVHLSLRPSVTDPDRLRGLALVWNSGRGGAERTLVLRADDGLLGRVPLALAPEETLAHAFEVDRRGVHLLEARLEPDGGDALGLDDRLTLAPERALLPVAIAMEGACTPAVTAVLAAHPGLRPVAAGAGLRLRCAATPPDGGSPTLWLVTGPAEDVLVEPPAWSVDMPAGAPPLAPAGIRLVAAPAPLAGRVLLAAGERPLLVEQEEPLRLVLLLDLEPMSHRPELPALLGLLLDRLAGRDLLAPVAQVGRDREGVQVAPGPLPAPRPAQHLAAERVDLAPWLLTGALGLALYDLGRRARAARST